MKKINRKFVEKVHKDIALIEEELKKTINKIGLQPATDIILAAGHSISKQNISNFMTGITRPSPKWILKFAEVLLEK